MSNARVFWDRVNEALDERRDPLADAEIRRLVAEHPERLDELVRLEARLATRWTGSAEPPRRRPLARLVVAASAVLVGLVASWWWLAHRAPEATSRTAVSEPDARRAEPVTPGPEPGTPGAEPVASPADQPAPRVRLAILRFEAHTVLESARDRTVQHLDGTRVRTRSITTWSSASGSPHTNHIFPFTSRLDSREIQR